MKTICDFSTSSQALRPQRRWSLARVFENGAQGAWFDPSDLSTLFQDAAGTLPVTGDGQPVGRMLDKSGNGHHALQTAASARPIYRADGQRRWLEFDGVDDLMVLETHVNLNAGEIIAGMVEPTGVTTHSCLLSAATAGYIAITGSGTNRSLGKNAGGAINRIDTPEVFPMTQNTAIRLSVDQGTLRARRWNDMVEDFNAVPGSANLQSTEILMSFSEQGGVLSRVNLFGLLLFEAPLTEGDSERCLSQVHSKISD